MARIPLFPEVLLKVYKCIGESEQNPLKPPDQKKYRSAVELSYEKQATDSAKLLKHIMDELNLDDDGIRDALGNIIDEWIPFNKDLEMATWTHQASRQQVIWHLLCYSYAPLLGRRLALWQLDGVTDPGMPAHEFWYLPQISPDTQQLRLPVERVLDWWLDLMGDTKAVKDSIDLEQNQSHDDRADSVERSLKYWRAGDTLPNLKTIEEYFSDEICFQYKNAIEIKYPEDQSVSVELFHSVLAYIKNRGVSEADLLKQIPVNEEKLQRMLHKPVNDDSDITPLHAGFVREIVQRYQAPNNRTLRQRMKVARLSQDGYLKLQKYLSPGVGIKEADPTVNKILQAIDVYMDAYRTTVDCSINVEGPFRETYEQRTSLENRVQEDYLSRLRKQEFAYFVGNVPLYAQFECFAAISPGFDDKGGTAVGARLSRKFEPLTVDSPLPDLWLPDDAAWVERTEHQQRDHAQRENKFNQLRESLALGTHAQVLPDVTDPMVLAQAMEIHTLNNQQYGALVLRVEKLALTQAQRIPIIRAKLRRALLLPNQRKWNLKTKDYVDRLITAFEDNPHRADAEPYYLHYKARHLLCSNQFEEAAEVFEQARTYSLERNCGRLTGEIALNAFALLVGMNQYIPNQHESYYRYVIEYPVVEFPATEKHVVVEWMRNYFWKDLYRRYPGIPKAGRL